MTLSIYKPIGVIRFRVLGIMHQKRGMKLYTEFSIDVIVR